MASNAPIARQKSQADSFKERSAPLGPRRAAPVLPIFIRSSSSAVQEKYLTQSHSRWLISGWTWACVLSIKRFCDLHLYHLAEWLGRKPRSIAFCLVTFSCIFCAFAFAKHYGKQQWLSAPYLTGPSPTLVFCQEDLRRIWEWEVTSGHYPSRQDIPKQICLSRALDNPSLPPTRGDITYAHSSRGVGPMRAYLQRGPLHSATGYPSRLPSGSIADLDVVLEQCDFSRQKYVRDCLEVLRVSGGLDISRTSNRVLEDRKYIYVQDARSPARDQSQVHLNASYNSDVGCGGSKWEAPPTSLPPPVPFANRSNPSTDHCDDPHPHVFHMFWAGLFTDKPYLALLSFLYTQNIGLHQPPSSSSLNGCRPQVWVWINPGPAASVPNPDAVREMEENLRSNPWASPFFHPRLRDTIKFKLWNTTEQLDRISELKGWRTQDLFNSGGDVVQVSSNPLPKGEASTGRYRRGTSSGLLGRVGSTSLQSYDKLSVILSDMARFILCHRFGGIYLDTDTILLRDWSELFNYPGAFAYRWSRLPRYNTAVLKLNRGSALGQFLFATAARNGLDFHPMTITRYLKDAHLEGLLARLPDAMFDPAWLSTEGYQLKRPPLPLFTSFEQFFKTPALDAAAPQAIGFDGFFRGAYSYHFHNFWWQPFDSACNIPDLGTRFNKSTSESRSSILDNQRPIAPEKVQRKQDRDEEETSHGADHRTAECDFTGDLSWAAVLKRTFESYMRGEQPNMYGEWIFWE